MSVLGGPLDTGDLIGPGRRGPRRSRRTLPPGEALRSSLIALVSTRAVLGGLAVIITSSPNWPEVQLSFFDGVLFNRSLTKLVNAFVSNIQLFLLAEALILPFGLVLAVCRGLPGPVFFPVRLLATIYVDL